MKILFYYLSPSLLYEILLEDIIKNPIHRKVAWPRISYGHLKSARNRINSYCLISNHFTIFAS